MLYATFKTQESSDTTIPQTGDGSNMMLWIGLLAASGAGVYGMTLYSRKKKEPVR